MGGIFLATNFTEIIKNQSVLSNKQKINIIIQLSIPTILSQISSILMQYIDAAMVGHLGPDASASIGIVSTSSWLLSGLCSAMATSFAVQVAQLIGASQYQNCAYHIPHFFLYIINHRCACKSKFINMVRC